MVDLTGFYIWIGIGLLIAGLIGLLKLGLWVWLATRVFHRVQPDPQPQPRESTATALKAWLGVIATGLGIVTTIVGLVKECGPSTGPGPSPYLPPPPQIGSMCCTWAGRCQMMMMAGPIGTACTCVDLLGNVAQGTICQ